jgi:hypothetical protein
MDNNNKKNTRRASEPNNNNNSLALVSGFQYRVPPPLPYLPSDYLPSPDSPRHIFPRKRSHSFNTNNPVLAIENGPRTSNFELVPYRDFTVIS